MAGTSEKQLDEAILTIYDVLMLIVDDYSKAKQPGQIATCI